MVLLKQMSRTPWSVYLSLKEERRNYMNHLVRNQSKCYLQSHFRTLYRAATPPKPAKRTPVPTSTHTCLHAPTPLCQSPRRGPGQGHHPWRARGAFPTLAGHLPAWETGSSSCASCRPRWRGWRAGARTWKEKQKTTSCQKRVSLGGRAGIRNDDTQWIISGF